MLAAVLLGIGLGLLASGAVALARLPWNGLLSLVALWTGLGSAIAYALWRSRPAGLFAFKLQDVLWGIGCGLLLRIAQGWLSNANESPFPSAPSAYGQTTDWWWTQALPGGMVGPLVEEMFFRCVLLVAIYQFFRRRIGSDLSGLVAIVASGTLFVGLHAAFLPLTTTDVVGLSALALTCGLLVMLTGRIWGAVLAHVTYNVVFLTVTFVGTTLAQ